MAAPLCPTWTHLQCTTSLSQPADGPLEGSPFLRTRHQALTTVATWHTVTGNLCQLGERTRQDAELSLPWALSRGQGARSRARTLPPPCFSHLAHSPTSSTSFPIRPFSSTPTCYISYKSGPTAEPSAASSGGKFSRAGRVRAGEVSPSETSQLSQAGDRYAQGSSAPASELECTAEKRLDGRDGSIVHPTALVHPDAVLMEGVEIGPFCTVGPLVRLGQGCKLHANCHVAGDTVLGDHCVLYNGAVVGSDLPGWTRLGSHNKIGHYAVVGIRCQDLKYKEGSECFLEVGSHNDIREHAQIHRSSKTDDVTTIGDRNLIMGSCHIAHDCKIGDRNILANNTLLAGHVILHDFIHTGGAVAVHQFCHLGSYSFLAGGAMVTRDVPTYTMVSGDRAELRGLNLEGLRRCGFTTEEVRDIRKAYQKLFLSSDSQVGFEERLTALEVSELGQQPRVTALIDSIKGSFQEGRRGICSFRHWSSVDKV